jgi:hypothetical protein
VVVVVVVAAAAVFNHVHLILETEQEFVGGASGPPSDSGRLMREVDRQSLRRALRLKHRNIDRESPHRC